MSLASRSARGALFLSASTITNIVIGFFGGIVLARLLNPDDFGTFALAATVMAFVDIRSKLQLEQKYLRDPDQLTNGRDTFFTLITGLTAISSGLLFATALGVVWFNRPDVAVCLVGMGLLYLVDPLATTIRLSIEKRVTFRAIAIIQTTTSLAQFTTTLIGAAAHLGVWSLLFGQATGVLLNLLMLMRISSERPTFRLDLPLAREYLSWGLKYGVVSSLSGTILGQFDNLAIGLIGGTAALGFYDRAYRTSSWSTILISASLGRISLPTYAQLQSDLTRLSKAFSLMMWMVLTLATPISLVFLLTAPDLVPTLYGEKWLPSVPILQWLAVFAVCRPLLDDTVSILLATNRPGQLARLLGTMALVMVVLVIPLTWLYSSIGTAIGTGVAFMIASAFLLHFGYTQLKVNLWQNAGRPLLNSLLTLVIYVAICPVLSLSQVNPLPRLVLEASLILGLYGLISLLTSYRIVVNQVRYIFQVMRGER